MRTLLLASTALVAFYSPAMAADVLITSTVDEACEISADTNATLPSTGAISAPVDFTWSCNYGGEGSATITFDSAKGGVQVGNTGPVYVYDIVPTTGGPGDSALAFDNVAAVDPVPNTDVNSSFTLQLDGGLPIEVAGVYTDTLSVTIAP